MTFTGYLCTFNLTAAPPTSLSGTNGVLLRSLRKRHLKAAVYPSARDSGSPENMGRAKGKYMQEVSPVEAMSNPYHGSTGNPRCASSGGNITFVCETSRRGERCARGESKQGPFFQDKNSPCKLNNDARFRRPDERSTAPQPVPSVGSCVSQLDVKKSSARRPKNI